MGTLTLRYKPEDEWHGELSATVSGRGFSGSSSAWFSTEDLSAFVDRLSEYPLKAPLPISLIGGYVSRDGQSIERHVSVKLAPHDSFGGVRVVVELVEPFRSDEELSTHSEVRVWLVVTYNDLERFQRSFRKALSGQTKEAELTGTE